MNGRFELLLAAFCVLRLERTPREQCLTRLAKATLHEIQEMSMPVGWEGRDAASPV